MDKTAKDRQEMLQAIGECIMAWSAVERALTVAYCSLIDSGPGTDDFILHANIFDGVISLDARLQMIESAVTARSGLVTNPKIEPPDHVKNWTTLRKKVRKSYTLRNGVAHSDLIQTGLEDGGQKVELFAFPTISNIFSMTKISIGDMKERSKRFEKLCEDISNRTRESLDALGRP